MPSPCIALSLYLSLSFEFLSFPTLSSSRGAVATCKAAEEAMGRETGLVMMEPDDIVTYAGTTSSLRNFTTICTSVSRITSKGYFFSDNPLHYAAPLMMMQLFLASAIILILIKLLKPLRQPTIVSQILVSFSHSFCPFKSAILSNALIQGGILLGPSFLGRINKFEQEFFPLRAFIVLDTLSTLGYMFYFFLVGVRIDPWFVKKLEVKTFVTGLSTLVVAMTLSTSCAFTITKFINVGPEIAESLPAVAVQESVLAFPIVAQYLADLKIINSEFGRMALSSSLACNLFSFAVITFTVLSQEQKSDKSEMIKTVSTAFAFTMAILFVLRPIILWMMHQTPKGQPVREECIYTVFVGVLVTGFISQAIGLHIIYGPLIFGMSIPPGPPLGSAIVEKLELITSWLFMPLFFIKNGLVINIFGVEWKNYFVLQFTILIACTGKFLGTLLPSILFKMPFNDAAALGLVMNVQGVLELGLFKMMKKAKAINNDAFVVMCTSMLIVTGMVTPIIKYLYDPSKRYVVYRRRTMMHLRPNSELRTLVCIHNQENVPAIMNLLEAFSSSKQNPVVIYVLHLVELVARANPLLIDHRTAKRSYSSSGIMPSENIINAFRYYERNNHEFVSVHPFTATTSYATMHDDVCMLALDKKTSLIIIPFHKGFAIGDALQSSKKGCKIMNDNVLDKAPCSVAILVDRGLFTTSRAVLRSWSSYRVAVLFLGGADDREALALGSRMAGHPNINLTMVRLLENGNITNYDMRESKLDNESVSDFRLSTAGNYRVMYIEEVVMDGSGTVSVIRSMERNYELIIVGRHHGKHSSLISGITDWNEQTELGAIGDMLASADFRGNTTVLVVQQHTNAVNELHEDQAL